MQNQLEIKKIIDILKHAYPNAKIALKHNNPLELLIATILSAQCTDVMVNKVTEKLFNKYKKVEDYANVDSNIFEQEIRSTGFFHNKAKNIINLCKILLEEYNGDVPKTMDELVTLPGVGRKTANIVLGSAFKIVEGIAVDTHVLRLSGRLGLTKQTNPKKIEQDLMKLIPHEDWLKISYLLIEHGRKICISRKLKCSVCLIGKYCPSYNII